MTKIAHICYVKLSCHIGEELFEAELSKGFDISLSFGPGGDNPSAFGIPPAEIHPIRVGNFVGSVAQGSGANCDIIRFCAHGNVTHTECIGHITSNHEFVSDCITEFLFTADLITVGLSMQKNELVLLKSSLQHLPKNPAQAIIIRTLPNEDSKKNKIWSGNNPPFFATDAMELLREKGYEHLLTDLPSVDPEEDDGLLAAHHAWWDYPENPRRKASITELIYVPDSIEDGRYILNLQFPKIQSDASPSRAFIWPLKPF